MHPTRRHRLLWLLAPLLVFLGFVGLWLQSESRSRTVAERAVAFLEAGDAATARTMLERVVERDPGHGAAWDALGAACRRLGDTPAAVAARRRALELETDDPALRSRLADDLIAARLWAEAEWQLDLLASADGWSERAVSRRAVVRARRGLVDGCLRDLERRLDGPARSAELLLDAAVVAWIAGGAGRSRTHLRQAHRHARDALEWLDPTDPDRVVAEWIVGEPEPGVALPGPLQDRLTRWRAAPECLVPPDCAGLIDRRVAVRRIATRLEHASEADRPRLRDALAEVAHTLAGRLPADPVAAEWTHLPRPSDADRQRRCMALVEVAARHMVDGDALSAVLALDAARWLAPRDARLLFAHGACLGRLPAGIDTELASRAVELERPGQGWGAFHRAAVLLGAGRLRAGHYALGDARAADPENPDFRDALRRSAMRLGDLRLAALLLDEGGDGPLDAEAELARAELAVAAGDWDDARRRLLRVTGAESANGAGPESPDEQSARQLLAALELGDGRPAAALRALGRRELDGSSRSALLRARAHLLAGRHGAALRECAAAEARHPVAARLVAASVHARRGDAQLELESLRAAVLAAHGRSDAHIRYALALGRDVGIDAALARLDELAEERPDDWGVLHARGRLLSRAGRWEDAVDALRRADRLCGGAVAPGNDLAWALGVHLHRPASALPRVVELRARRPRDPELADTEGTLRYLLGDTSTAVALLHEAADAMPHRPDVLARFAHALADDGESDRAADVLRRARRLDPTRASQATALLTQEDR